MKQLILSVILSLFVVLAHGQGVVNKVSNPGIYLADGSKFEQHKKTFEIKNIPNPSEQDLEKIDLSKYTKFYRDSIRVEVLDSNTGFTLILYSNEEMRPLFNSQELLIAMPIDQPRDASKSFSK